jgi:hypothetical protein
MPNSWQVSRTPLCSDSRCHSEYSVWTAATGCTAWGTANCPHRGKASGGSGACYVNPRTPASVWRAFSRGNVRPLDLAAFKDRKVRFGAYGDPAAVPFEVWQAIAEVADGITGYTHQWRACDPRLATVCMASCDSIDEYRAARRNGWRGFVVRELGAAKPKGLVQCPATAGKDNKVTCLTCMQSRATGAPRPSRLKFTAHRHGRLLHCRCPSSESGGDCAGAGQCRPCCDSAANTREGMNQCR